jgi:hypothetical protein
MTQSLVPPPNVKAIDICTAELAVAFQRQIDAGTVKIYRETLSDLPLWAIQAAALQLRRKGGSFFPTAPVWHEVAEAVIADRVRQNMANSQQTPTVHCEDCRDTGMREGENGRYARCPCAETNPNYQRGRRVPTPADPTSATRAASDFKRASSGDR